MKRIVLFFVIELLSMTAFAQSASEALIVVKDFGGVSALPYFEALNFSAASLPVSRPAPPIRNPSDAEAVLLPVRSELLSPGEEPPRIIHAPGLTPLFLIGDDAYSRDWLRQRQSVLRELGAIGLVVNVSSPEALAALRNLVPDLTLSPVSGDDLAQRLGLRHYPVLITATGIRP
jgi:integrating conjugative element protein (TIGR03765 family)